LALDYDLLPSMLLAQRQWVLGQSTSLTPTTSAKCTGRSLTTGPSVVAWAAGFPRHCLFHVSSLWNRTSTQHQRKNWPPDQANDSLAGLSRDGRWVLFKYHKDALNWWALDLKSSGERTLSPARRRKSRSRFSPDGTRIVFVSNVQQAFPYFRRDFSAKADWRTYNRLTGEIAVPSPQTITAPSIRKSAPLGPRTAKRFSNVSNRGHIYRQRRVLADEGGRVRRTSALTYRLAPAKFHYEETIGRPPRVFSRRNTAGIRLILGKQRGTSSGPCQQRAAMHSR